MFTEQKLALSNLRFLARGGAAPEFYDRLQGHLLQLAKSWEGLQLSARELDILNACKRQLLIELKYLRGIAAALPRA